jgi:murein L,D-transpeptidase YcbB/YkuD
VQASGDGNALGVIKFVFSNPYSVYLHDTNQRYLFGNAMRSISHGCVRVQEWEKLATYLVNADQPGGNRVDSMKTWLRNKEKRSISLKQAVPVFIRYFTCAGGPEGIRFFDDVYGEDQYLEKNYFPGK